MTSNYKPRNILITGGACFVGSRITNTLIRNYPDYRITVLDHLDSSCSNMKNLNPSQSSPNFRFVKGEIAHFSVACVEELLITDNIDTVMHFTVHTLVYGSLDSAANMWAWTLILLDACKRRGGQIKRFIHASTDEVDVKTVEDGDVKGKMRIVSNSQEENLYAASKVRAEMFVRTYEMSSGLPVIIARVSNVYGPNQFPVMLIPKFILLAMRGATLPLHGDGSQSRRYLYCEDVVEAFDTLLHKGESGHVYEIGTKQEKTVIEVAKSICKLFHRDPETSIEFVEKRDCNEQGQRIFLDDHKLNELGWSERTTWEDGLKKTIEWYRLNSDWWGDVSESLLPHGFRPSKPKPPRKPRFKFLIYGKNDWIGETLGKLCTKQGIKFEFGWGSLEYSRSHIEGDIRKVNPTHVLNAAGVGGWPDVDWCESNKTKAHATNVVGTLMLADVCRLYRLPMMHFASGCIFEYDATHPVGSGIGFKEEDRPNFFGSFYSMTMAMAEELLKEYDNVCTLRMSMAISSDLENPRNFITEILSYDKVANIPNSMTILDELLPISIEMAKKNLRGIWNFTNPGVVSQNEILEMYKNYIDPDFKWNNLPLEEQAKVIVAPRSNNELDASKLKAEFPDLLSIKESLIKYVFEPNKKTA